MSLFGTPATQQPSGSLFGTPATQQPSGSLFGQASTSTGLFGNSVQQQQTSQGLFGTPQTRQQTSQGLFGTPQPQQQPQQASLGVFGASQQQQSGNQGRGLFGGTSSNSLFGGSTSNSAANTGGSLFGPTQQQQTTGGLFGNTFIPQHPPVLQQQQLQTIQQPVSVPWWYRELMNIQAAYQMGQGSRFQTMLYEVVGYAPDLLVHRGAVGISSIDTFKTQRKRLILQRNPWIDEREWQRADDNNPDPINWMACPVIGIGSLYNRMEAQADHVRTQLAMLSQQPVNYPNSLSASPTGAPGASQEWKENKFTVGTVSRNEEKKCSDAYQGSGFTRQQWLNMSVSLPAEQIEACRHEHIRLKHRLIKALGRLERLQCSSLPGARSQAEVEFDQRLSRISTALTDPRGFRAQLTSLVTQMELDDYQNCKLSLHNQFQPQDHSGRSDSEFAEQDQQAIFNFLELQRDGIGSLMKIVKRDMRDLEIIKRRTQSEGAYNVSNVTSRSNFG